MLRKESDGFFNVHTVSFMTVAVFLTVFSVAYADWHNAKITGHVINGREYQEFYDAYIDGHTLNRDYESRINNCLLSEQNEEFCDDYIDNCIYELKGEIDRITVEQEEADNIYGCRFLFEEAVSGVISDPSSFGSWEEEHVTPYVLTSSCEDYVEACSKEGFDCNGLVLFANEGDGVWNHYRTIGFFEDRCYVPETTSDGQVIDGSTKPPQEVVEQVSKNVDSVKESVKYADSVKEIISTKELSESDLSRYKTNLEEARKIAEQAYKESSQASSKYSSVVLSDYQQELASNVANIEKRLREVNNVLSTTVEQRFEQQTKQAVWSIARKDVVKNSYISLEDYASSLVVYDDTIGPSQFPGQSTGTTTGTTTSGEVGTGNEFDLRMEYPGAINVIRGSNSQFGLTIYNDGYSPITNCRISAINFAGQEPNTALWVTSVGFPGTDYGFNSLGPGENGVYQMTVSPPSETVAGIYLVNFRVFCNQGQEDGFTMTINLQNQIQQGQNTGQLEESQLEWLIEQYPLASLSSECLGFINMCSEEFPNTCGDYEEIYSCAYYQECNDFEELCVPSYIPQESFDNFMSVYVSPYYNLPPQCAIDVSACSTNSLNCPSYIYECIMNQNCNSYIFQCLTTGSAQQGSSGGSGNGGSSGGSSGGNSIGSVGTTVGGLTAGSNNVGLDPCRGDSRCHELIKTCLTPSYIIATELDLVDFGGFGYNAVTGDICYMGTSGISTKGFGRVGGSGSSSGGSGGVSVGSQGNPNVGNSIISIHFQNGYDGERRNYVAAIVYSLNGHLTLNFLNSPDYGDLEDKIQEFIQNLLYGDENASYVTGMSLQQAEEIVSQSASVPWVLWIILFVMVTSFVFFGNMLSPYNERLISSGRKALNKKDYSLAVQNYNELASLYAVDPKVKQDALEYLRLIREKIGKDKVELEFAGSNELPKVKTSHSLKIFSDYSRVQKMIAHALQDVKKSPKMAKSRMPMISEEYKRLSPKDKDRLASEYESLVYKLRNI